MHLTLFWLIAFLYSLAILIPGIAVSVRRLHDTDRSGLWLFIYLIPLIGGIMLLVFMVQDSTQAKISMGRTRKPEPPNNPADDARGNAEALLRIKEEYGLKIRRLAVEITGFSETPANENSGELIC